MKTMGAVADRITLLHAESLPRPRLLSSDWAKRFHVFRAPPGHGKSVAMAQLWAAHRERGEMTAFVSAKHADYDPDLLAQRIYGQLLTAENTQSIFSAMDERRPRNLMTLADRLDHAADRQGYRLLICIDDIGCDSEMADRIEDLMLAAPPNVAIAAAMTADIGFARVAAQGQVEDVTVDKLNFSLDEARAVACGMRAGTVSDADLLTLWERTRGWAAPLILLLRAATSTGTQNQRLVSRKVTGRDCDLDRYFRSAILASLSDELREFCIRASVLDSVSAEYFDQLFGGNDGARLIEKLCVERMLLRPMDRNRSACEFHPLLREFLEHRYAVEYRSLDPERLAHAAEWQRQSGNSRESISLYLRAGEKDTATEMASSSIMDIALRQGEVEQIQLWKASFSEMDNAPTIALGLAWAQIFSLGQAQAAALIADIDAASSVQADDSTKLQLQRWRDLVAAVGAATADDLTEARRRCELWIKQHDGTDLVGQGAILTCLSFIAASEHRFDDLVKLRGQAASVNTVAEHRYALGWLHATIIFGEIAQGHMGSAADLLRNARDDEQAQFRATPFSAKLLDLLELEIDYEANRLGTLGSRIGNVLEFVRHHGVVDLTFLAFRTAAAFIDLGGDRQGAIELLQEARVIASEHAFPRLDALARIALADMAVMTDVDDAVAMLPAHDHPAFLTAHGPALRARASLSEARIALRQGKFHLCRRSAIVALEHARRNHSGRLEISAMLCLAAATAAAGRTAPAEQIVADAVDIALRKRCFRTLLDERRTLERLGSATAALINLIPDEQALGAGHRTEVVRTSRLPKQVDVPTLTRKELAILHRVKEGLSNREIAIRHRISENTVKWHLHKIFGKLQVRNRVQAVLKAEGIGFLD